MEYVFTERAHLMCPQMYFGIAADIKTGFDESKIRESFSALSQAHPFLKALLGYDEAANAYFYNVTDYDRTEIIIREEEISAVDSPAVMEEFERLTGYDWDLFSEGMCKAAVWKMGDHTCVLFVIHHLLADGRGLLGLVQQFADLHVNGTLPQYAPEKLISSGTDIPAGSQLPFFSRFLVDRANKNWRKESLGRSPLSYGEYHAYADRFIKDNRIAHSLKMTDPSETGKLLEECRKHSVTVNDYLMAKMYNEENTDKVIIASDIRPALPFYMPGALGNYSTAFSVVIKKKSSDIFTMAGMVHERVRNILNSPRDLYLVLRCYAEMEPALLDAAFMAGNDAYKSKSAAFIGKVFFGFAAPSGYSITNLGRITSESIDSAYFIPPASPAIRKTWGVLTVNGRMAVCTGAHITDRETQ